jgi:hypothetical protein
MLMQILCPYPWYGVGTVYGTDSSYVKPYHLWLGDSSMTQQLSIETLQQLAQLEELTEGQMNQLLQRLESQKLRLPVEDHPIIDWGIGMLRARAQEEESCRMQQKQKLDAKYRLYQNFQDEMGLNSLNLADLQDQNKFFQKGWYALCDIVDSSFHDERILKYVDIFLNHLLTSCKGYFYEKVSLYKSFTSGYVREVQAFVLEKEQEIKKLSETQAQEKSTLERWKYLYAKLEKKLSSMQS